MTKYNNEDVNYLRCTIKIGYTKLENVNRPTLIQCIAEHWKDELKIPCAFGNPAHIIPLFKIELKYISDTYSIVWTRQWFPEGFLWCLSFHLNLVPKNIETSGHVVFIIWEQLSSNLDKKTWSHFLSRQLVKIFIGQVVVFNPWPQSRWNMKRNRPHLIWDQQRRLAFSLSQLSSIQNFIIIIR